jgi:ABC-type amino acid transport system permease subunit
MRAADYKKGEIVSFISLIYSIKYVCIQLYSTEYICVLSSVFIEIGRNTSVLAHVFLIGFERGLYLA